MSVIPRRRKKNVHKQKSVRVLIVDDSEPSLEALCSFLGALGGIEIVGTARNGFELLKKAVALQPDLVITDLHMPRMSGLECTLRLREIMPATRFIIFTNLDTPFTEEQCGTPGADFYVYKEHMPEKVVSAIRQLFPEVIRREPDHLPPASEGVFC
jgi:DNA-binding NarL/FixJ family response regulator